MRGASMDGAFDERLTCEADVFFAPSSPSSSTGLRGVVGMKAVLAGLRRRAQTDPPRLEGRWGSCVKLRLSGEGEEEAEGLVEKETRGLYDYRRPAISRR